MKTSLRRKRAQSTLEYAVVIVCIAAALLAMQLYFRRAVQGRIRESADNIGDQYSATGTTSTTDTFGYVGNTTVSSTETGGITNTTTSSGFNETHIHTGSETIN